MPLYAGFDTSSFPGAPFLKFLANPQSSAPGATNLSWCGFYLTHGEFSGKNTAPGSGNHADDHTWVPQKASLLGLGWSIAPIFLLTVDKDAHLAQFGANAAAAIQEGTRDGEHTIVQAEKADLPKGSVIYMDWEFASGPSNDRIRDYWRGWIDVITEKGFRPGFYCFQPISTAVKQLIPDAFFWVVDLVSNHADHEFVRENTFEGPSANAAIQTIWNPDPSLKYSLLDSKKHRKEFSTEKDAVLWQWVFFAMNEPIAGHTNWPPAVFDNFPGVNTVTINPHLASKNGQLPKAFRAAIPPKEHGRFILTNDLDMDSSVVGDPLFPERRLEPRSVRKGRTLLFQVSDGTALQLVAVWRGILRVGAPDATTWAPSNGDLIQRDLTFHPWCAPTYNLRRWGSDGFNGTLFAQGRGTDPAARDDLWNVYTFSKNSLTDPQWTDPVPVFSGGPVRIDARAGLSAVARNSGEKNGPALEVYVVVWDDPGWLGRTAGTPQIAVGMQPGINQAWNAGPQIVSNTIVHPPGGVIAVSRVDPLVDLFYIQKDGWRLNSISSTKTGTYGQTFPIGDIRISSHPLVRISALCRKVTTIDVFLVARPDSPVGPWSLYRVWWQEGLGWMHRDAAGSLDLHAEIIAPLAGDGQIFLPDPLKGFQVMRRGDNQMEALAVRRTDGMLYHSLWDGNQNQPTGIWSAWQKVPIFPNGSPLRVLSIGNGVTTNPSGVMIPQASPSGTTFVSWDRYLLITASDGFPYTVHLFEHGAELISQGQFQKITAHRAGELD